MMEKRDMSEGRTWGNICNVITIMKENCEPLRTRVRSRGTIGRRFRTREFRAMRNEGGRTQEGSSVVGIEGGRTREGSSVVGIEAGRTREVMRRGD